MLVVLRTPSRVLLLPGRRRKVLRQAARAADDGRAPVRRPCHGRTAPFWEIDGWVGVEGLQCKHCCEECTGAVGGRL